MRYLPALDGLRGVAVLGVLLFHAELPIFHGGFLGVSTFFTLSGFLITSLLLDDHDRLGRLQLRRFWVRRVRRLMPAALLALVGVAVYASLAVPPDQLDKLRGDLLASLFYVANWHFVFSGQTYATMSAGPSLLQHFWSLSIEEQFYLVFPLVALLALRFGGRRLFARVVVGLSVLSVASSLLFAQGSVSAEGGGAAYYATNTRAVELLLGALLAIWLSGPGREERLGESRLARRLDRPAVWSILGGLALLLTIAAWGLVDVSNPWLARGGLALHAVAVDLILLAIVRESHTGGPISRILGVPPLRRLGQISYGVYLFHWPLFLALDEQRTGLSGVPLFLLRIAATLALAVLSYVFVEQPIRRSAPRRRRRRLALLALPVGTVALVGAVAVVSMPSVAVAHGDARLQDFRPVVSTGGGAAGNDSSGDQLEAGAARTVPPAGTVLVIGDSAMYDVAPALSAAATSAGVHTVVDASYPGVGLTSGFDWRSTWRQLVDRYDPDLVVIMIGRWDQGFLRSNGVDAYRPLADEAARLLTSDGAHILWVDSILGPGTTEKPELPVFHALPSLLPGRIVNGNVNSALQGADGNWLMTQADPDGTVVPVRKPDRYHLCQAGAERVTDALLAELIPLGWVSPPGADWRPGSWRSSERYDSPPKGCDPLPAGTAPQ